MSSSRERARSRWARTRNARYAATTPAIRTSESRPVLGRSGQHQTLQTSHIANSKNREAARMPVIALRPVEDGDLDALFDQMRDPKRCG